MLTWFFTFHFNPTLSEVFLFWRKFPCLKRLFSENYGSWLLAFMNPIQSMYEINLLSFLPANPGVSGFCHLKYVFVRYQPFLYRRIVESEACHLNVPFLSSICILLRIEICTCNRGVSHFCHFLCKVRYHDCIPIF